MKRYWGNILLLTEIQFTIIICSTSHLSGNNLNLKFSDKYFAKKDTVPVDTIRILPYDFKDEASFAYPSATDSSKLFLKRPSNIKTEVKYDPISGEYIFYEKVGDINYRLPKIMSRNEFQQYDFNESIKNYWRQRSDEKTSETKGGFLSGIKIGGEAFNKIFGGNTVEIRPQGYVEVSFGYQVTKNNNTSISESLRKVPTFDFDQKIQMNVTGKIGTNLSLNVNYNTDASFDYENKMSLNYTGNDDNIIKKVEAGNVSLPLNGTLITGASNLFGVKTEMQFGKMNITSLFSQSKGETKTVELQNGAQKRSFEIDASDYDANRHFFLSQYFKDHYDAALKNLPVINSSITINKIEIWVTNKTGSYTSSRNILALMDLGEHQANIYNTVASFKENSGLIYPETVYPFNAANGLYQEIINNYSGIRTVSSITKTLSPLAQQNFIGGVDYEKVEQARLLSSSEYTINEQLGYISLNAALSMDEVLAVAYNYTANGQTYQVGEFSSDGIDDPQTLVVKMLKGTNLVPKIPTWDLMMKNIYSLNASDVTSDNFTLNILYLNSSGNYINYFPTGEIAGHNFLGIMNLDRLNSQNDNIKDGAFDFVDGITINKKTGRIIFPVLQPFGKQLRDSINNESIASKYVYQTLYDSTQVIAQQDADHDKYILKGYYKGTSSSEISIGSTNLTKGSVSVSSGGIKLSENVDYIVDYTSGTIKLINQALIDSGTTLTISTETEEQYSVARKTLLGTHANYAFSNKFSLGGTVLHMQESPLTTKVNYGDDPISNTMLGLDATYTSESNLLTKIIDKLPFITTKEKSSIAFEGEYAQLLPGHSNVIGSSGTSYIDDFEATKTSIDMRSISDWTLASTPQGQENMFPEGNLYDDLAYGYNRSKLAWYNIDAILVRGGSLAPSNLKGNDANEQLSNHYVREVYQEELFPDKETELGVSTKIATFDLAYYPEEKGPYNYDALPSSYSAGMSDVGLLENPETRWGGIMRKNAVSNFETANIAYIEFWMMDPFIYNTNGTDEGGDLYFDLGEISEDILKDGRKSYENGLPSTSTVEKVDSTLWGRVSTKQSTTYEFTSGDESRKYQDVGFDGLNDTEEQRFFNNYLKTASSVLNDTAYEKVAQDPSSDNFHYFRGSDYDTEKLSVLERYKKYNGTEGNSTPGSESYSTIASTAPNIEDINSDNTMNEYERYYQYKVRVRPDEMVLGENHIVDIKEGEKVKLKNGNTEQVKWYQFRIPIKNPDQTIGSISNFKSIRFTRLFLRNFKTPTILRFATLDLVRADWRKYSGAIQNDNTSSTSGSEFDVSAVSIEENGSRDPVNYILPPGIERTTEVSGTQIIEQDEQSLDLKVIGLEAGYSQAAYKSTILDLRNYKRLIMDVHAEAIDGYPLNDNDLSLFLRFGSDYNTNYYEYEVPLSLTPEGDYSNSSTVDRYAVWPNENRINVLLSAFTDAKKARNAAVHEDGSTITTSDVYKVSYDDWLDGQDTIRIKGNPSLSNVEVMMIGIRHKKKSYDPGPKSVEVWTDELRLVGFNEEGGWAANAHVTMKLADLGTLNVAASKSTAGFGSISSKVDERSTQDISRIDISSNLELGKFFPEKSGVKIPTYFGYSRTVSNPKYNPLDEDLTTKESLKALDTKKERDSLKHIAQEVSELKSISFTNVKIDKTLKKGKTSPFDPTNFSATYTYNESYQRDVDTEYDIERNYRGIFSYNYSARPKLIEPFKKSKLFSSNAFKFIRDFNFYPFPSQISFRLNLYRHYNETQIRDLTNTNLVISPTYDKVFTLDQYFDLNYDLSRSLKLNFSSQTTGTIDEPEGRINKDDDDYRTKRDSIIKNLLKLGRPTGYSHTINATYAVPINKIKLLDWTSVNAVYKGTYQWTAGNITDESIELGNEIQNTRAMQLNGQLNFITLYNKVGFLKEVNQKYGKSARQQLQTNRVQKQNQAKPGQNQNKPAPNSTKETNTTKEVQYTVENVKVKKDTPKSIFHKLNTTDVEVKVLDSKGKEINGEVKIINTDRITFTVPNNMNGLKFIIKGRIKQPENLWLKVAQISSRFLMSVRNASISYSTNEGTFLPGFLPEPGVFGFGSGQYTPGTNVFGGNLKSTNAPGIPFLLGWQNDRFALKAIEKGWVTKDTALNSAFIMNRTEMYNFRVTLEPVSDLKVVLNAARSYTQKMSEYYSYDTGEGKFNASSRSFSGNFSMTINSIRTSFSKMRGEGVPKSKAFDDFKQNRQIISRRLAAQRVSNSSANYNPSVLNSDGTYSDGYGQTSQLVMIPAFIAAYTGQSPEKVSLSPFPSLKCIRPNWQLTYDGLVSKIDGLNRVMKSMSVSHTYRSTYSISSYSSNLDYDESTYGDGFSYVRNSTENFLGLYDFSAVNITEQLNPLLDMNIVWKNDFETEIGIKRNRNITLSLTNNRITEILQNELTFGLGYRFTHMDLIIKTKKSQKAYSNDLNIKANLSFARNKTILRQIEEGDNELSAGQNTVTIKTTADYLLSNQFQMSLYFDKILSNPLVGSFDTSTTNFGISFKFNLATK